MLREVEQESIRFGIRVRVIVRQLNRKSMNAVLKKLKDVKTLKYGKEIKYVEKINISTLLIIYGTVDCYASSRFRDFINVIKTIHEAIVESTDNDYLLDFVTTNRGFYDFSLVGSKHYIEGKLTNEYYIVEDSILSLTTFLNRDEYLASLKYKYLKEFLPTF